MLACISRRLPLRRATAAATRPLATPQPQYHRHNHQQDTLLLLRRWASTNSDGHAPPPRDHHDDESFAARAARVKHELSVVHSVAMAAHVHDKLKELRAEAQRPDLWDRDQAHAASVLQQLAALESREKRVLELRARFLDAKGMYALASEENEQSLMGECADAMTQLLDEVKTLRVELLLSSESDFSSCFVEIQAGAGGTESCDWVAMLARMYQRWADTRGFRAHYADESPGEEAGFRAVTLRIHGAYAYGWAKTEAGVHRLVRMSPFDSAGRRHTSFAQVRVYPMAAMSGGAGKQAVEIPAKDLRIDTYRSSGAGGQHVNTTDSAVRIVHLPTNTVVTCQSDRSQHRNKAEAMDMLRAKLYQRELEEQARARHEYTQGLGENAWGSQIRSYVLHPYKMVKDHRTKYAVSDTQGVLDGHTLDRFMEEMLLFEASGARSEQDE